MLTNRQIFTLFLCNESKDNRQPWIPAEIVNIIAFNQAPSVAAAKLLHHVAYGELDEAKQMIASDPTLLLQASDVETPAGLLVKRVTAYECALGSGDPEMTAMIKPYFAFIFNGDHECEVQYEKYRWHIANITQQKPYDLTILMRTLINSTNEEIEAALLFDNTRTSALQIALAQFRKDFMPGILAQPGMHFNYQNLFHAYKILEQNFYKLSNNQCLIFFRQILGYELRSLPARDRQIYAWGLFESILQKKAPPRTFALRNELSCTFPITAGDSSQTGLGYDYYFDIFASWVPRQRTKADIHMRRGSILGRASWYSTFINEKIADFKKSNEPAQKISPMRISQ
jgi:hypothetical protein